MGRPRRGARRGHRLHRAPPRPKPPALDDRLRGSRRSGGGALRADEANIRKRRLGAGVHGEDGRLARERRFVSEILAQLTSPPPGAVSPKVGARGKRGARPCPCAWDAASRLRTPLASRCSRCPDHDANPAQFLLHIDTGSGATASRPCPAPSTTEEGLAREAEGRSPRGCHHGQGRPHRHVDRDRGGQHAREAGQG